MREEGPRGRRRRRSPTAKRRPYFLGQSACSLRCVRIRAYDVHRWWLPASSNTLCRVSLASELLPLFVVVPSVAVSCAVQLKRTAEANELVKEAMAMFRGT